MQKKTQKAYIIYKYNNFNNDYEYIKEYYNKEEIMKDYNLKNKVSIYHYITKNIDAVKQLLNDKYIIIQETI